MKQENDDLADDSSEYEFHQELTEADELFWTALQDRILQSRQKKLIKGKFIR